MLPSIASVTADTLPPYIMIFFPVPTDDAKSDWPMGPVIGDLTLVPILHLSSALFSETYHELTSAPEPNKRLPYTHLWERKEFRGSLCRVGFLVELAVAVMGAVIPPSYSVEIVQSYDDTTSIPFSTPVSEIAQKNVELFVRIQATDGDCSAQMSLSPVYFKDASPSKSGSSVEKRKSQQLYGFNDLAKASLVTRDGVGSRFLLDNAELNVGLEGTESGENVHLIPACRGQEIFKHLTKTRNISKQVPKHCKIDGPRNGLRLYKAHHSLYDNKQLVFTAIPNHTMHADGTMRSQFEHSPHEELSKQGARLLPLTFGFSHKIAHLKSATVPQKRDSPGDLKDPPLPESRPLFDPSAVLCDLPAATPLIHPSHILAEPPFEVWTYSLGVHIAVCAGTPQFYDVTQKIHQELNKWYDLRSATGATQSRGYSEQDEGTEPTRTSTSFRTRQDVNPALDEQPYSWQQPGTDEDIGAADELEAEVGHDYADNSNYAAFVPCDALKRKRSGDLNDNDDAMMLKHPAVSTSTPIVARTTADLAPPPNHPRICSAYNALLGESISQWQAGGRFEAPLFSG